MRSLTVQLQENSVTLAHEVRMNGNISYPQFVVVDFPRR